MSFFGSHRHSIDAKKRVFIPAKFREELGDEFYITRKFDKFLSIYTAEDWRVFVDKINKIPESDALEMQNFLLGAAQRCTPDSNGRIILEDELISHAGIKKDLVFVGVGRQIRIFAEEEWAKKEKEVNLDSIRDKMRQYNL